jgi:hypothetical protein
VILPCRRLNPHTNSLFASYSLSHRGFTLTPTHNFAKKATMVSLSKKLGGSVGVKGSYAPKDQAVLLELGRAPFTVRSRINRHPWMSHDITHTRAHHIT